MSKTYWKLTAIVLGCLLFMIACGGSASLPTVTGPNGLTATVQNFFVQGHAKLSTPTTVATAQPTSNGISLIPAAYAQTPTTPQVKLTGNYYGKCVQFQGEDERWLAGLGTDDGLCGSGTARSHNQPETDTNSGAPIIGTGTLTNFVILADEFSQGQLDSMLITVYVNGQPTVINCNGKWQRTGELPVIHGRCKDVTTRLPLNDAGTVAVSVRGNGLIENIRFYAGIE